MDNFEHIDITDFRTHLESSYEGRLEAARIARGLAETKERLSEELKEVTREYAKQYDVALRAGWTPAELNKFGISAPTKRARKPRKSTNTKATKTPEPETKPPAFDEEPTHY